MAEAEPGEQATLASAPEQTWAVAGSVHAHVGAATGAGLVALKEQATLHLRSVDLEPPVQATYLAPAATEVPR